MYIMFNSNQQVKAIILFKYNNTNKTNYRNNYNKQYSTYRQTDTMDSYLIVIDCTMYIKVASISR
jgi:hypothetical protein